jgi:hypothetical protein
MDTVSQAIIKMKPNLSLSSVKSYISSLKSVFENSCIDNRVKQFNPSYFVDNYDCVMKHLMDLPITSRKTKLAAIVVMLKAMKMSSKVMDMYTAQMKRDKDEYEKEQVLQKRDGKIETNWMNYSDMVKLFNKMKRQLGSSWDVENFDKIQELVLLGVCLFNVRRIQDYTHMKLNKIDNDKDNYIINLNSRTKDPSFVFNSYKTASTYGKEEVVIHKEVLTLLKKFIKLDSSREYLFMIDGKQITQPQMTRLLNRIFGKPISVNMIRHAYLTETYKDIPALAQLKQRAQDMGHSLEQALEYVKK